MALILDAAGAWSAPVALASDEIWQARKGAVFVTTTDTPDADDGLALVEGEAVFLSAGSAVKYRKRGPTDAVIAREAV